MFFDKNPPAQKSKNEFPSVDSVVTVANCWYYLSLLERFVDITSTMSENVLKMYLVRAEYRYFQWMFTNKELYGESKSIPPVGKKVKTTIYLCLSNNCSQMSHFFGKRICLVHYGSLRTFCV